jgi:TPR repeat protein
MKKYLLSGCIMYAVFGLGGLQASQLSGRELKEGVVQDLKYYQQAALRGDVDAMYVCGMLLETGEGEAKDLPLALSYYAMAAAQDDGDAAYRCGELLSNGEDGIKEDLPLAFNYYFKAANEGHVEATYECGLRAEQGVGVRKNLEKAFSFYDVAANLGHLESLYRCGELLSKGEEKAGEYGFERNLKWAFQYYEEAASKGHPEALKEYIRCWREGIGTAKNPKMAERYEKGEKVQFRGRKQPL